MAQFSMEIMRLTGSVPRGNQQPVSEFNIWADPESAEVVFSSGMPITMIGWDISRKYAVITDQMASEIRSIGSNRAEIAMDCQRTLVNFCRDVTGVNGFDLPDPMAIAVAIEPSLALDTFEAAIHVSLNDDFTRGQTIIDDRSMTGRTRNVTVVSEASSVRFQEMLFSSLE